MLKQNRFGHWIPYRPRVEPFVRFASLMIVYQCGGKHAQTLAYNDYLSRRERLLAIR